MTRSKMVNEIEFSITPEDFLREIGWSFSKRGSWLSLKNCPFCSGGQHRNVFTFAVHSVDGNYFCHRTKCGEKGNFWNLIQSQGKDPKQYLADGGKGKKPKKKGKKKYIYGR